MKVFIFLISIATFSIAERLLSTDELEKIFRKFVNNNLTEGEKQSLEDVFEIFYAPEHYTSAETVEYTTRQDTARSTIQCLVCRSAFAALFEGVQNEQTDEQLENALSVLCVSLGIQNENVCRGAIGLNINILTYIVRNTPEATPESFCSLVLQTAFDRDICPSNDARFEWVVELPPQPTNAPRRSGMKSTALKAAILTDAHIDPLYEAFGVADCDEPVCCRTGQLPARSHVSKAKVDESIITESLVVVNDKLMIDLDIAEKIKKQRQTSGTRTIVRNAEPAGYWGDYRNCDTPLWAYDDVIDNIASNHQDIDIVYYIGDSIDHGVWETSYDLINEMNLYIIEKLRRSFGDDVLVVPVIGNHEAQPTNQFAPSYVTGDKLNTTWLYDALATKWDFYLTEEAKASLRERGDFSMLIAPGLRVITVNNNVSYRYNWWLVFDPLDAKRHLDWLVEELYRAELAGESVHILMHIPPGVHDLQHTWTREYNRIINRFSSTIKAEFNGHVHSDEFKIFYNLTDNTPINVAWGAGGATAFTNYNLNYKIVTFDPATYEPLDIVNYVYNLTEANLTPNRRPHWFQLYDLKQRFGMSDLSAGALDDLVTRMVTDNRNLLDMYVAFTSKMSDTRWPYCDNNCKIDSLCRSVVTVLWDREKCEELRTLYFL